MKPGNFYFPPELRTASIVPRWSIVWTLNKDTVSNHSFFVVFYAFQICMLLGKSMQWAGIVTYLALTHDLDETITGDIVSPVKREILGDRAEAYIKSKMQERLPSVVDKITEIETNWDVDTMWAVITVADRLDALLFLITEHRMGNHHIDKRIPDAHGRLKDAWDRLPAPASLLSALWEDTMEPAIDAHQQGGGYGLDA